MHIYYSFIVFGPYKDRTKDRQFQMTTSDNEQKSEENINTTTTNNANNTKHTKPKSKRNRTIKIC